VSLSREDVLRELELWPLWRLRHPSAPSAVVDSDAHQAPAQAPQSTAASALQTASVVPDAHASTAPLAHPLSDAAEAAAMANQPPQHALTNAAMLALTSSADPVEATEVQSSIHIQPPVDTHTVIGVQTPPVASAPVQASTESPAAVDRLSTPDISQPMTAIITTDWLLLSALPTDQQLSESCATLLQNIARVLSPPGAAVQLHTAPVSVESMQATRVLLCGLAAANTFLSSRHDSLSALRGQVLQVGERYVVVTHPPEAMLQQPALKAEVWQDICLLLSHAAPAGLA